MLILFLASLTSWFLILWRNHVISKMEKYSKRFRHQFRQADNLVNLAAQDDLKKPGLPIIFHSGFTAFNDSQTRSEEEVLDSVERTVLINIGEHESEMEKGLSYLAIIGSVSPYIGLLGTVWGIMNSFIGLSQVEQATLNTVAPGIAEALIATAIGLFAAIPAVVAYNRLSARANSLASSYYHFGNELVGRLKRVMALQASA
jgi:biopolymer transport protein TolQ